MISVKLSDYPVTEHCRGGRRHVREEYVNIDPWLEVMRGRNSTASFLYQLFYLQRSQMASAWQLPCDAATFPPCKKPYDLSGAQQRQLETSAPV